MKNLKIAFLSIGLLIVSCSRQSENTEVTETAYNNREQEKFFDVKYGPHERNIMDVYLPAGRNAKTAFVINIHGGAWTHGDKGFDTKTSEYLLSQGIAVANLNYRYANSTDTHLPELLDDIDNAVKYLSSNSKQWNTRNTGFSISGTSSGAHVSLMYAYTRNPQIKSIVEIAGSVDFTDIQTLQYLNNNIIVVGFLFDAINKMSGNKVAYIPGGTIPEAYTKASPVKFVRPIPIMIIHGDKDDVVPVRQAYILEKELKAKNVQYKFLELPGVDHSFSKQEDQEIARINMAEWIKKYGVN